MHDNIEPIFKDERHSGGDNNINVEKVLSKIVVYWPLFALCIVLACAVAYVYLRYTTPIYEAHAKVLIKDEKKGGMPDGQVLEQLGVQSGGANVENESEIIKSRTLMEKVVRNLDLNIHYYAPGRIKTSEYYYKELPFKFTTYNKNIEVATSYNIHVNNDNSYTITVKGKEVKGIWGDPINLPIGKVVLTDQSHTANPAYNYKDFTITITPVEKQAVSTLKALTVEAANKKSSVLELTISDILPERGEDILNELLQVYMQASIDDRNTTMEATVDFIDKRLILVSDGLSDIEKNIEQFKSKRRITDLAEQSKLLLDYSTEYSKQITQKEVQLRVVESLIDYMNDEQNKSKILPSSLLVQDESSTAAMEAYNDLQLERSALLMSRTEDNPEIKKIDFQLENIRKDLVGTLSSMSQSLKVSIKELERKSGLLDNEIRQVPEQERIYLEFSRQQHIKQELYLFLLKKREETAISKSSTVANSRIIDPARAENRPYTPRKSRVYLAAIALGLIIPGIFVFLKELFNVRINNKEDIKRNTRMSIIGEIARAEGKEEIVVHNDSKTVIAEQFRLLRTNLQFLLADQEHKTILLTSSMSGEGKSFIALNLSVTLAISGAKVVLLELDLRKPKISANLNLDGREGFTEYVIGKAGLEQIMKPSGVVDTLHVISSGAIPPNPSELMLSKRVPELLAQLKQQYDYIIIDSAPVGLVTDAQLLSRYTDTILYVCRMNYTYKEQLRNADELSNSGKLPKMNLVINDMKTKMGSYGYGYGYGSYEGYFNQSSTGVKGLLNKFKIRK